MAPAATSDAPAAAHPVFQRTSAYSSEPLAMLLWGCACLLWIAVLLAFAWVVEGGGTGLTVTENLHRDLSVVTKPAVAVPIATALAIAFGWCLRGVRLAWLAWSPGPIVVSDSSWPRRSRT